MYKNLEIWQKSVVLIKKIYTVADSLPKSEEYNLKSQIKRAVVSVALNIAEGKSRKTAKDFSRFLDISVGSVMEVEACLSICEELGFIKIDEELHNICKILSYKIKALQNKILAKEKNKNE